MKFITGLIEWVRAQRAVVLGLERWSARRL